MGNFSAVNDGLHPGTALQLEWRRMHRTKCGEALPSLLTLLCAYLHRSLDLGHDVADGPALLFGVPSSPADLKGVFYFMGPCSSVPGQS